MIDVMPVGPDAWLATCECGQTMQVADEQSGWTWVLEHPCTPTDTPPVVTLTEPTLAQPGPCRLE